MVKEVMKLKESEEGCMGTFGQRKENVEIM